MKLDHGDAVWIYVDIDGAGKKWRLGAIRGQFVHFPFDDFEDYKDHYEEKPDEHLVLIERPPMPRP